MTEVSTFRLYMLRAMYLFIVLGLGVFLWPSVLDPTQHWGKTEGMATCMLAAFSIMCVIGLRYPVQVLPVLIWECAWKTLWLVIVPLPQWWAGHIDAQIRPAIFSVSMVLLVYLAVPWGFVFRQYVVAHGERWR